MVDMNQFHQVFIEESIEGIELMENILVEAGEAPLDDESMNALFRAAHSIKGGSGTFGFSAIADFTHHLETLLDHVRHGDLAWSDQIAEVTLLSIDVIKFLIQEISAGEGTLVTPDKIKALVAQIEAQNKLAGDFNEAGSDQQVSQAFIQSQSKDAYWLIHFTPHRDMLTTGNEPIRMIRQLYELGELEIDLKHAQLPSFSDLDPEACYLSWEFKLKSEFEQSAIQEVFEWVEDECDLTIELIDPQNVPENEVTEASDIASNTEASDSPAAVKAVPQQETSSIRVAIDKIDSLVNLVGELVITQSMLSAVGKNFDMSRLESLKSGLVQLQQNTREMQEQVMSIRMLPMSFVFNKFPRMVRDISKKLEKDVALKISGEQTELDKTVMEKIGDPLVHLVRNAIDHGLETQTERAASGKPEQGSIMLNAYQQSGNIVIEVSDDGRGLDAVKIKQKAIEKGVIQPKDQLSDQEVYELIMRPGFSTADEVSDLSGRGVGMDVVKRNVESLGGTIHVSSEQGQGSCISIGLPLTLAILDGQLVEVAGEVFIIPVINIIESIQPEASLINEVAGGCDVFRLRQEYIPIVKLSEVFSLPSEKENLTDALMVVIEINGFKMALVVDDLLDQQQVVIKNMESNYKKVKGISGATILGDGRISLILELVDMIEMAGIHQKTKNGLVKE
jgi:two-component system chemotaxis sensor kinase CheA